MINSLLIVRNRTTIHLLIMHFDAKKKKYKKKRKLETKDWMIELYAKIWLEYSIR